mmetsp:Transcript_29265/g.72248  ORF Transcript_29265/g.72248 Transcript_29265/m.72248 type:complete len:556 (+) Transcript_29265:34-1701(+)
MRTLFLLLAAAAVPAAAFLGPSAPLGALRPALATSARSAGRMHTTAPRMGLLDGLFGEKTEAPMSPEDALLQRDFRPPARQDGVWEQYSDERGQKYYYNTATQETLWENEFMERTKQMQEEKVASAGGATEQTEVSGGFGNVRLPLWMQNKAAADAAPSTGPFRVGSTMDPTKFKVAWRQGGGTAMQKGGFGYVYFGTYDARPNANARPQNLNVCVKLPNTDPDAVQAHKYEIEINKKISNDGGIPGVADFLGTVDLSPIKQQLPNGIGSMEGMVWTTVQGRTLDQFFDRGGSMSPVIANTLQVRDSSPVRVKGGGVVYIKTNLCKQVLGQALLPVAILHDKGIIHRDLKPKNIMLAEKDLQNPFCVIDFGSAVEKGQRPFMNDFTEIYAPPEAPIPSGSNPFAYDIYTLGIIGLRVLMPSLVAGENGIATLGLVTTSEIPSYGYNLRQWAEARATDISSKFPVKALNKECEALLNSPEILAILERMLTENPTNRPSAEECLAMLGPEWTTKLQNLRSGKEVRGNCGSCGQPVFSSDKGRFRDARGVYYHSNCSN